MLVCGKSEGSNVCELTDVVFAYDDYGCTSLVGSVPSNGKCIAATKAKIGSWQVQCNTTEKVSSAPTRAPYLPGELKRRSKMRISSMDEVHNMTAMESTSCTTTDATVVASSVANEISSAVNASATQNAAANITSSPSAGAALSSAISSGTAIEYNLTAYVTAGPNSTYTTPSTKTATSFSTVTYTGTRGSNGTVLLHVGGSSSNQIDSASILVTFLCGVLAVVGAISL